MANEPIPVYVFTGFLAVSYTHLDVYKRQGQRHNLEQILVFNEDATVNANGGKYEGMDRYECRKAVVKDLSLIHI